MKRTIKVRAWNSKTKRFVQEDTNFEGREGYNLGIFGISANGTPCFFQSDEGGMTVHEYENVTLTLFVGMLDKKAKEVYEDDIVEIEGVGRCRVIYVERAMKFYFQTLEGHDEEFTATPEKIKVIGNVYENPELLTLSAAPLDNRDLDDRSYPRE